jgi:hypothetical protein
VEAWGRAAWDATSHLPRNPLRNLARSQGNLEPEGLETADELAGDVGLRATSQVLIAEIDEGLAMGEDLIDVSAPSNRRTRAAATIAGSIRRALTPMRSSAGSSGDQCVMQPQVAQ